MLRERVRGGGGGQRERGERERERERERASERKHLEGGVVVVAGGKVEGAKARRVLNIYTYVCM